MLFERIRAMIVDEETTVIVLEKRGVFLAHTGTATVYSVYYHGRLRYLREKEGH